MSKALKQALQPKSDQLNADDLITGDIVVKITKVIVKDSGEQRIIINYEGDNGKPFKPSVMVGRILTQILGEDETKWVGHSMRLFRDPDVKWAGVAVGGIRVSHVTGIKRSVTLPVTISKGVKKPFTVKPLETVKESEMPSGEFNNIIMSVDDCGDKDSLTVLNIAQYKDQLSTEQMKKLRDSYKAKLETFKQEEIPV